MTEWTGGAVAVFSIGVGGVLLLGVILVSGLISRVSEWVDEPLSRAGLSVSSTSAVQRPLSGSKSGQASDQAETLPALQPVATARPVPTAAPVPVVASSPRLGETAGVVRAGAGRVRVTGTDGEGVVLRSAPRPEARIPLGFLEGAALTLLEPVAGEWAHVRGDNGQEGWVPARYVVAAQ